MNMNYCDLVRERAMVLYDASDQSVSHRMDHIERVLLHARVISTSFPDVDQELLTIAVLLHDVTSPFNRKHEHVRLSMKTARDILDETGYPPDRTERVVRIIAEHSTEDPKNGLLSSVEARVLFDADKIDGAGPVGLARAFALFGQQGHSPGTAIGWYRRKIETALCHMQTDPGRTMLLERLPYVEDFLEKFEAENAWSLKE